MRVEQAEQPARGAPPLPFRDIDGADRLGTLDVPHRLPFGAPVRSRPPGRLFRPESLPQPVIGEHNARAPVAGGEYLALPGYQMGSVGLLQRDGEMFLHGRVLVDAMIGKLQSAQPPPHWIRGLLRPDARIVETASLVGAGLNPHINWGHFLFEMWGRVHLLATLRNLGAPVKLAVPEDVPAWMKGFVSLYFPPEETISYHSVNDRVQAPCFIAAGMMANNYHLHPYYNVIVEDLLHRIPVLPVQDTSRLLYLSRSRHSSWHAISNEAEVERAMQDMGFTVVHPQELTLPEQLALYRGASCIAGQYGSALHNTLFAPLGSAVFCIGWMNALQSRIAALRGQTLGYQAARGGALEYPQKAHESGGYRFEVDCRDLARTVPEFLDFAGVRQTAQAAPAAAPDGPDIWIPAD